MNKVILMGRLTRDVDLRQTPSGVSIARFTIAVDRGYTSRDGQRQTDFINCAAWRNTGENIARFFNKGRMIAVEGSIQTRSWDGQDGKKQYATEVVVENFYFTGSRSETGGRDQNGYGGGNYGGGSYGGYQNSAPYQAPVQNAPAPQQEDPFGGFDDGGFMDIDGSEDDLPF